MSALQQELLSIIKYKKLTPHFQPIVSLLQKKIIGYEALIRGPSNSPLHSPLNLFDIADRYGLSSQLEFVCRELSIQHFAEFNLNAKLFLNVSPHVLLQPEFKTGETLRYLERFGLNPHKVVIELTEYKPVDDYELMREAVMHYRSMGFEIALDDLGAGYSSLRLWSELLPEYVKIDQHFIQGVQDDSVKLNFIRSIQGIASSLNCNVIAEGIETEAEFNIIEQLGISHGQGYYFARPSAIPLIELSHTEGVLLKELPEEKPVWTNSTSVESISQFIAPISAETLISDVMNLFQQRSELTILPLVDYDIASGIIIRDVFLSKLFSSRYGMELYGRKPIKTFIDQVPLSIDHNTPIELVSQQLTSTMRHEQAFIITRNSKYMGVATILSLLEKITLQQIDNAKHANPLTLLPGSVPMNEQVDQLLISKIPFAFGYFDLDNFKPFNDIYSYSAGDDIIKAVATALRQCVPLESGRIGHIGGDDFIVIFTGEDWLELSQQILATFEAMVPSYYTPADVEAGGIHAESRTGEKCFFPMTSLSVGLVSPTTTAHCQSHVDIADLASESKKMAKKIDGNSYFVNHRQSPKTLEAIQAANDKNSNFHEHDTVVKLHAIR
ncbi:MAG: GGDEF domain-containing protein [Methylococcales bacterium]|nr:GGDEF domain-containing protein [Methylococcales bacterium]MDD5753203.1 GGDEF domain-containing protein [Methylococcales bacterium]